MRPSTFWVRASLLALLVVIPAAFLLHADVLQADAPKPKEPAKITHQRMEMYPSRLQARLELRNRFRRALPGTIAGHAPAYVLNVVKKWQPGQTLRVAFRGGDAALYEKIATATKDWTDQGNIVLDFKTGDKFRTWSTSDKMFQAEVRISFDHPGYYSLVGTDSTNPAVTRPEEESMNFEGFDTDLPSNWRAVVLHEFGHALGFEHEHQSPNEGCQSDFRWEDDAGYVPTTDQFGQYIPDSNGKRPGIYTVLGGPPNNWPRAVVDFNLKQLPESHAYEVGPFDKKSIMKYFFPAWMFSQGEDSHCFSAGENQVLSAQDIVGIKRLYPKDPAMVKASLKDRAQILDVLSKTKGLHPLSQKHYQMQMKMLKPVDE